MFVQTHLRCIKHNNTHINGGSLAHVVKESASFFFLASQHPMEHRGVERHLVRRATRSTVACWSALFTVRLMDCQKKEREANAMRLCSVLLSLSPGP